MRVTVALGYENLWVDSLCIVQDDDFDKAHQIALMPQIYMNAAVTILASRPERAVEGFLAERSIIPSQMSVRLPFHCPDECLPRSSDRTGRVYALDVQNDMNPEPIDYRAWTLQERYLSPRILEFGSEQVAWACCTQQGIGRPTDGRLSNYYHGLMLTPQFKLQDLHQDNGEHNEGRLIYPHSLTRAQYEFYNLVEIYSQRRLSVPSDRILAISGIAEEMRLAHKHDAYQAGIWSRCFQHGLLWRVEVTKQQRRPSVDDYQAPSWSWGAVNGPVNFIFMKLKKKLENLGLETDIHLWDSSAPCGAVTDGRVRGRGFMCTAVWFAQQTEPRHYLHRYNPTTGSPSRDECEEIPMLQMFPDAIEEGFENDMASGSGPVKAAAIGHSILVHLLLFGEFEDLGDINGPVGLVLRETRPDSSKEDAGATAPPLVKQYSRLGVFSIHRKRNAQGMQGEEVDSYFRKMFQAQGQRSFEIV